MILKYYYELLDIEDVWTAQDFLYEIFLQHCENGFVCIGSINNETELIKVSSQIQIPIHVIAEQYVDYIKQIKDLLILISSETSNKISLLSPPLIVCDNFVKALKQNVVNHNGEFYYLTKQKIEMHKILINVYKNLNAANVSSQVVDRCIDVTNSIYNIFDKASFAVNLEISTL